MKRYSLLAFTLLLATDIFAETTTIKNALSAASTAVKASAISGRVPLHIGRKTLIQQMDKHPDQLTRDIKRIPITIGKTAIPQASYAAKSEDEVYAIIAREVEKYAYGTPTFKGIKQVPNRIGPFWTPEIIYAIVQTFSGPPNTQAYNDIATLTQFMPKKGATTINASFVVRDRVLEVTTRTSKIMINPDDDSTTPLITTVKVNFELDMASVTFDYSYVFKTHKKSWHKGTHFSED